MRSKRLFDEISIRIWNFDDFSMMRLMEILGHSRETIRKISFGFTALTEDYLIRILSFLPKLEEIVIDVSLCNASNDSGQRLNELSNVRSFTCKVELAKLIAELPRRVLEKLSFTSSLHDQPPSNETMNEILQRQRTIEDLNFNPLNTLSLEPLKLKKLRLSSNHHLTDLLQNQSKLKALVLQANLTNKDFDEICKLKDIEHLEVNLANVNQNSLKNLNSLMELRELSLTLETSAQLAAFNEVSLPKLLTLNLKSPKTESVKARLAKNFPALTHLKLTSTNTTSLSILFKHRRLQSLSIELLTQSGESESFGTDNESLREFSVMRYEGNAQIALKLFTAMSGVEKVHFGANLILDCESLRQILTNHRKMSSLSVHSQKHSIDCDGTFTKVLKEHGERLTRFEFSEMKTAANLDKLQENFDTQFELIYNEQKKLVMRNHEM